MGRYGTVLVSDATAPLDFSNNTVQGMITRLIRSFDIVFDTSLELRRERFLSYIRRGALPGCCVRISDCVRVLSPNNDRALGYGPAVVKLLTGIRSDINAFSHGEAGCLVNHGYALADAALGGELADSMGAREAAFAWPFAEYGEDVAAGRVFS